VSRSAHLIDRKPGMSELTFSKLSYDVSQLRKISRVRANFSILLLTLHGVKAYQAHGVNFLPMSASSELEPGPRGVRLVAEVAAQVAEGVRRASHELQLSVRTAARGAFTAG
jgi:hypothetical protein